MADRFRTPRKEKQWERLAGSQLDMTVDGVKIGNQLNFSSSQTVIRMVGEYIIGPTSAPTALDACNITVAIGKVSTDAATAGAGSLPDPASEGGYPWLYWMSHAFEFPAGNLLESSAQGSVRRAFDIRSMRKFKPSESLVWLVDYTDFNGAPPMTVFAASVRVLVTIH